MSNTRGGLMAVLEEEWVRDWATSRAGVRALARWSVLPGGDCLTGYGSLNDLVTTVRGSGIEVSDPVAQVLINAAQSGDRLAGRVVVQVLVPFITAFRTRFRRQSSLVDVDEVTAEIVATVYERIAAHDLAAHSGRVVAYLALTTRRALSRLGPQRRLMPSPGLGLVEWCTGEHSAHAPDDDPDLEAPPVAPATIVGLCDRVRVTGSVVDEIDTILTTALTTGAIRRDDAELVVWVASGYRVSAIGAVLERDVSVIRRRLYRATTALAQVAA